ncbi:MAG: c-type cytochrome [Acidobacteria bacterium]|nr:c-type cytochrome [Acidobacteriota bacterium]
MLQGILDWLDDRTGAVSAVRHFLDEDIPASAGWHQVLGSVALFCFMTQTVTGLLLAFNYGPTPGEAHASVKYIMNELTGGPLIRGIHHWGASMMIIVVALHMVQVLVWGAYKRPREATWIAGLVLLQLVLAFGLTGYLLPWDNRAYWGTVVTTQIASKAPVIGQYLARLMGAEDGTVGSITFARFYTLHVMLLPLITTATIGLHVFLVRRHGVTPAPGDEAKPKKKFYPQQVFKDTIAIFAAFLILVVLAVAAQAPLGRIADPTDTHYIPRPEWYFLFLFQTLKFFEGPLEIIGSMVLPGLALTGLALLPFIDRGQLKKVTQRTTAILGVLLAGATWAGLTAAAIRSTPPQIEDNGLTQTEPQSWQEVPPIELSGAALFRKENCTQCHKVGGRGTAVGPDLVKTAGRRTAAWMIDHFRNPAAVVPGSEMPSFQLTEMQMNALAAFLLKLNPKTADALAIAPEFALEGALVYQRFNCGVCHQVNGAGMKQGPVLNGLKRRRTREWIIQHFRDPKKLSPGSTMPPYKLADKDLNNLTDYLLSIE